MFFDDVDLYPFPDLEFVDLEPLDEDCDIVGVRPHEAVALLPSAVAAYRPFTDPPPFAPEDMPTEEFAALR